MGCNCGKKAQILNYENSRDHINLIESTFRDIFSTGTIDSLTDLDKIQLVSLFKSIYPNSKVEPSPDHIVSTLQGVVDKFYTKRR